MNEVSLRLEGMNCTACAEKIQAVLAKIEGVHTAQVSYEDGRATVSYDPGETAPDALTAAINTETRFTARRVERAQSM